RMASRDAIAKATGTPDWKTEDLIKLAKRWSWPALRRAYALMLEADLNVKRGLQDDASALQLLVHELARLAPAAAFGAAIALALTATEASACGGGSKTAALVVYEAKAAKGGPGAPSYTPEEGDTDGYTQVYVADAKKGTTRRVTDGAYNSGNPAWSPDRSRIIFKSDRDNQPGRDDLYTMKADGSDVRRLTETPDIRE